MVAIEIGRTMFLLHQENGLMYPVSGSVTICHKNLFIEGFFQITLHRCLSDIFKKIFYTSSNPIFTGLPLQYDLPLFKIIFKILFKTFPRLFHFWQKGKTFHFISLFSPKKQIFCNYCQLLFAH